ncbi:MAG: fatty acid desaturase [Bacteriovorax sp.]
MIQKIDIAKYPIPGIKNLGILIMSVTLMFTALWQVQLNWMSYLMIPWIIVFVLVSNTIFSLLHEAVHGIFHPNKHVNKIAGRLCAFLFPTSFSLQQIYHLGHHRRNRTDYEMFDLYYESDSYFFKKLTIILMMTGFYWSSAFFSCLLFFLVPGFYKYDWFVKSKINRAFGFEAMLGGLRRKTTPFFTIWLEILSLLIFWLIIFKYFHLNFGTWILCYWCFGIAWGSLQYTDHAFTKRDIRNGAWNLKVSTLIRLIYLNYHYHLVHHRYPNLPWCHLGKFVDKDEEQPGFFRIYFRLWRGPEKTFEKAPVLDSDFEKMIFEGTDYH